MATVALGRRDGVVARTTTDRALLRDFLEHDRLYAAYAICDLEEREFGRTRWGVAHGRRRRREPGPRVQRPDAPAAVRHGPHRRHRDDPARRHPAARRVRRVRPEMLPAVEAHYRVDPGPPMVRMWVDRTRFRPYPGHGPAAPARRDRRPQPALPARLRVVAAVEHDRRGRLLRRPGQRQARRRRRAPTSSARRPAWRSSATS